MSIPATHHALSTRSLARTGSGQLASVDSTVRRRRLAAVREQLRLRVLDSLGVALGALDGEPVAMVREHRGVARGLLRHPPCAVVVTPHDPVTTYPEH